MPGGLVSAERRSCLFPMEIAASELLWCLHVITPGVNAPFTGTGTHKHPSVPGLSCSWGFILRRMSRLLQSCSPEGPPSQPQKPAQLLRWAAPGTLPASKGWLTIGNIYSWGKPFHMQLPKCWLLFLNNSFSMATAPGVCAKPGRARPAPASLCSAGPASATALHCTLCLNPSLDFDRRFVLFWFEKIPFYTNTFLGVILPNTSFFSYQLRIIRWCMYLISLLVQVV